MALERIKALVRGSLDIKRLEKNGFVHGKNLNTQHGVIIDPGHCWLIECGDNVTLAPYVHIPLLMMPLQKSHWDIQR